MGIVINGDKHLPSTWIKAYRSYQEQKAIELMIPSHTSNQREIDFNGSFSNEQNQPFKGFGPSQKQNQPPVVSQEQDIAARKRYLK